MLLRSCRNWFDSCFGYQCRHWLFHVTIFNLRSLIAKVTRCADLRPSSGVRAQPLVGSESATGSGGRACIMAASWMVNIAAVLLCNVPYLIDYWGITRPAKEIQWRPLLPFVRWVIFFLHCAGDSFCVVKSLAETWSLALSGFHFNLW